jgi:hypothetical protein
MFFLNIVLILLTVGEIKKHWLEIKYFEKTTIEL